MGERCVCVYVCVKQLKRKGQVWCAKTLNAAGCQPEKEMDWMTSFMVLGDWRKKRKGLKEGHPAERPHSQPRPAPLLPCPLSSKGKE